jgi:hypothetical protein
MNDKPRSPISIVAFKNEKREGIENPPLRNVIVDFKEDFELAEGTIIPAGTKLEGGMWGAVSKNNLQYLSGTLREARAHKQPYAKPRAKPVRDEAVDF